MWAVSLACILGVVATGLGIVLAYDSYYWFPSHRGLPVSFFVVSIVVIEFALASLVGRRKLTRAVVVQHDPTKAPEQVGWV
jgi:zinc/manganese transport system permease protein